MSGYGEASRDSRGAAGHLYIEVKHDEHPWFERDGADLLMALPVNYSDIALGCELEMPHIDDEPLKVKIPSGSMPGDTITVKGRGFPNTRGRRQRGDVTIVLRLKSTPRLSRAAKKALEDLRSHIDDGATPEESARYEAKQRRK